MRRFHRNVLAFLPMGLSLLLYCFWVRPMWKSVEHRAEIYTLRSAQEQSFISLVTSLASPETLTPLISRRLGALKADTELSFGSSVVYSESVFTIAISDMGDLSHLSLVLSALSDLPMQFQRIRFDVSPQSVLRLEYRLQDSLGKGAV